MPLSWRPARTPNTSFQKGGGDGFQVMGDPKSNNLDLTAYPGNLHIKVTQDVETVMGEDVKYGS